MSIPPGFGPPPNIFAPGSEQKTGNELTLMSGLKKWQADHSIGGRKEEACRRIFVAYQTQERGETPSLDLSNLHLTSLPSEIGLLQQLQWLYLSGNQFTSLPPQIGLLQQLDLLDLGFNQLASLPLEIGQLRQLKWLNLSNNQLSSLPPEIRLLQRLQGLYLNCNQLTSLPPEIGLLQQLKDLYLSGNQLTSLPPEIRLLQHLQRLCLNGNPHLSELPLTLGSIAGLTHIESDNTNIPQAQINAVLAQCRALRDRQADETLPSLICTWSAYAGQPEGNLKFILKMSLEERQLINEWLVRLSKAKDFSTSQQSLTQTVFAILVSLGHNPNFKDVFFREVASNNECCGDRAAMGLNVIYTSWKIHHLPEHAPLSDALQLIKGVARTMALRDALAGIVGHNHESVEVFLYYEIALKNKLGLITAIENMAYAAIGKREWIKEKDLIEQVDSRYLQIMAELILSHESLKSIAERDPKFSLSIDQVLNRSQAALSELEDRKSDLTDQGYLNAAQEIMTEQQQKSVKATLEWLQSQEM